MKGTSGRAKGELDAKNAETKKYIKNIQNAMRDLEGYENKIKKNNYIEARSLLRFLETVMLMLDSKIIFAEEIFQLLSYRILLASGDPIIQNRFLIQNRDEKLQPNFAFCAIFELHRRMHKCIRRQFRKKFKLYLSDMQCDEDHDLSRFGMAYLKGVETYQQRFSLNRMWRQLWAFLQSPLNRFRNIPQNILIDELSAAEGLGYEKSPTVKIDD